MKEQSTVSLNQENCASKHFPRQHLTLAGFSMGQAALQAGREEANPFLGSSKWNLTEANWAVLAGLRQVSRAGLSTVHLFNVDAGCQGAHCPAEAQSCTTGADASRGARVTAQRLCQHWELPHAGIKLLLTEETLSPFLLFISCNFCYLKLSFYFQHKGTSPSPLLGLKQDFFWNFILIPSQTLRLNIYFDESVLLQWYNWCHVIEG